MDKSHVSLEQKMCIVCGQRYDTNALLLDKRLKASMERYTTTGYGLCEPHQKLWDEGYVALAVIDPTKSSIVKGTGTLKTEDAYRTGDIVHIKKQAYEGIFGSTPVKPVAFIDIAAFEKLKAMMPKPEEGG